MTKVVAIMSGNPTVDTGDEFQASGPSKEVPNPIDEHREEQR